MPPNANEPLDHAATRADHSPAMRNKLVDLADAVTRHVPDGATVFVGGFGQCIPFAIAHETIR